MIVPARDGLPTYDVLVQLRDVEVELGFRIDDVPMARAFALSYANSRSIESTKKLSSIR